MNSSTSAIAALTQALSSRPRGSRDTTSTSKTKRSTKKSAGHAHTLDVITDRMLAVDPRDVGDDVLLAMILVGTTETKSPLDEARRLIGDVDGNLADLVDEPRADLGLSRAGQARFVAAAELLRRVALRRSSTGRPVIRSASDAVELLRAAVGENQAIESFAVLALDIRGQAIGLRTLTRGSFDHTIVDPRQIARYLVSVAAKSVILVHNHPTGEPEPSQADLDITSRLQSTLIMLGIHLQDHLIVVASKRYVSFSERGLLHSRAAQSLLSNRM